MCGVRVQTLSNRAVALLVAAGVVVVDQITKSLALAAIDEPVEIIGDFLRLRIVRNPGAAFGRLTGVGGWLALVAVVVAVVLVLAIRRADSRGEAWVLGLILGGAVGNLVPATETAGNDSGAFGAVANGRKQTLIANLHGHVVVLSLVAEGTGHSATAGVNLADRYAGDAIKHVLHGIGTKQRFLMAVAVNENLTEGGSEIALQIALSQLAG